MLVVSLCSIGPILVIKVIESIDLVSKYAFYLPFIKPAFLSKLFSFRSSSCISDDVLMLCPLFPECSSSQFKSSFVSLVVIDVVPYCGLDDSVEESIHRDVVFRRR